MRKRTEQAKVEAREPRVERVDMAHESAAQVDAPREAYPYPVEIDGVGVVLPAPTEES